MKLTPIPHLLGLNGAASRSSIGRKALHHCEHLGNLEATAMPNTIMSKKAKSTMKAKKFNRVAG